MAFRKCRDCGQLVSVNAESCPSCGNAAVNEDFTVFANLVAYSRKTQKTLIKVAIVLAIIGIIILGSGQGFVDIVGFIVLEAAAVGLVALGILKVKKKKKKQKDHINRVIVK